MLLIVGAVLLLPPVGSISLLGGGLAGLPIPVVYVFAVWGLLIVAAAVLARSLGADTEGDVAAAASSSDSDN